MNEEEWVMEGRSVRVRVNDYSDPSANRGHDPPSTKKPAATSSAKTKSGRRGWLEDCWISSAHLIQNKWSSHQSICLSILLAYMTRVILSRLLEMHPFFISDLIKRLEFPYQCGLSYMRTFLGVLPHCSKKFWEYGGK